MKRALFISLLLHVCASAAAQNIEVRGDPAETTQIVLDSLATGIDGLPPMPASITYPDYLRSTQSGYRV